MGREKNNSYEAPNLPHNFHPRVPDAWLHLVELIKGAVNKRYFARQGPERQPCCFFLPLRAMCLVLGFEDCDGDGVVGVDIGVADCNLVCTPGPICHLDPKLRPILCGFDYDLKARI